jgi:superfamily I DNA/RNA helicase
MAVVIPELVQEVFPAAPWIERNLKQERRLFYVAFTRAKKVVALVYSDNYRKRNDTVKQSGVSQFVQEVYKRISKKD